MSRRLWGVFLHLLIMTEHAADALAKWWILGRKKFVKPNYPPDLRLKDSARQVFIRRSQEGRAALSFVPCALQFFAAFYYLDVNTHLGSDID